MSVNTYTLELPATKVSINQLVAKICAENEDDERVTLVLGTCKPKQATALLWYSLECTDPAERREFGTLVKQKEVVYELWNRRCDLSTYTLTLPATDDDIFELVKKIHEENGPDERVTLRYGNCKPKQRAYGGKSLKLVPPGNSPALVQPPVRRPG